ncbi:hypothetical protein BC940DRAFT_294581 [Gongronella butleri]|nr:hypothetical protein BC940DRAFT_294581 [Gongronella butleri]
MGADNGGPDDVGRAGGGLLLLLLLLGVGVPATLALCDTDALTAGVPVGVRVTGADDVLLDSSLVDVVVDGDADVDCAETREINTQLITTTKHTKCKKGHRCILMKKKKRKKVKKS